MLDEPLYAHWLRLTGAERPYRDLVLAAQEQDGNKVVAEQLLGPRQRRVLYAKHMAKQRLGIGKELLRAPNSLHVLLVRWVGRGWKEWEERGGGDWEAAATRPPAAGMCKP